MTWGPPYYNSISPLSSFYSGHAEFASGITFDTAGEMAKQPSAHVIPAFATRSVAEFASSITFDDHGYGSVQRLTLATRGELTLICMFLRRM